MKPSSLAPYRLLIALAMGLLAVPAMAGDDAACKPVPGYTIGFFNGVWNDRVTAMGGLEALHQLYGDEYDGERISYSLFYNHTGQGAVKGKLQDVVEAAIQRADEVNGWQDLKLSFRSFLVLEALRGRGPITEKLKAQLAAAGQVLNDLHQLVVTEAAGVLLRQVSSAPTQLDYAEHRRLLDELVAAKEKMIFVAHSQGNLFVNVAYNYVVANPSIPLIKVAHVAPASPTLRGPHRLSDHDLVINAIRVQGLQTVPENNLSIPISRKDFSGHTFIDTYLDPTRPGQASVRGMIDTALKYASDLTKRQLLTTGAPPRMRALFVDETKSQLYVQGDLGERKNELRISVNDVPLTRVVSTGSLKYDAATAGPDFALFRLPAFGTNGYAGPVVLSLDGEPMDRRILTAWSVLVDITGKAKGTLTESFGLNLRFRADLRSLTRVETRPPPLPPRTETYAEFQGSAASTGRYEASGTYVVNQGSTSYVREWRGSTSLPGGSGGVPLNVFGDHGVFTDGEIEKGGFVPGTTMLLSVGVFARQARQEISDGKSNTVDVTFERTIPLTLDGNNLLPTTVPINESYWKGEVRRGPTAFLPCSDDE